jgi:hypothetical protein
MLQRSLFSSLSRLHICLAVAGMQFIGITAFAQYGVSPSQTGLFFDDLRSRQRAERAATAAQATRDGDVVYDYDSGVYRSKESEPMGQRSTDYEAAREVARPAVRSGSSAYAARSVGDYTNYAGQYTSPTGFFAPTYVSDPFLNGRRNVRLGPVNVGFGLYQGFEYNDNVTSAGSNQISDVISTTMLNLDANYQITQNNRLSITTAIGVDHYFDHPELSPYGSGDYVLNVLPGSTIAYDIKAGPVYITLYDRMSVRPAVRNDFALSRLQTFGVFQNDAGIAANWRINSAWVLSLNYMHSRAEALDENEERGLRGIDDISNFSRTTDSIHGSLSFSPAGTWAAGVEGGVTSLAYDGRFNNDATLSNIGAFFVLPVGKTTYIRLSGGYQNFEFDDPVRFMGNFPRIGLNGQPLTNEDVSDLSDFYYGVTISNHLNSRISHSLSFGRESSLNVTSNYVTANYVNYGMSVIAWKGSRISFSGYLEDAEMSGGVYAQDVLQYGLDLNLTHRVTSKLSAGIGYHYGRTDTDRVGSHANYGTFDQHAINFDLTYALSQKFTLNFGYRFYITDMLSGAGNYNDQDFEQNRVILGLNYNF